MSEGRIYRGSVIESTTAINSWVDKYESLLDFSVTKSIDGIIKFLRDRLEKTGSEDILIPLSGGVDSAVIAYLSKHACSATNAITIVDKIYSRKEDIEDAKNICKILDVKHTIIDQTTLVKQIPYSDRDKSINMMMGLREARINVEGMNSVIPSGGNRSEVYGLTSLNSMAGDCYPLVRLYKTQVIRIANELNIPIANKPSHCGVKGVKNDEEILSMSIAQLDTLLAMREVYDEATMVKMVGAPIAFQRYKEHEEKCAFPVYCP